MKEITVGFLKKVLAFVGIATIGVASCGVSASQAASNAKAETSCAVEAPAGLLGEARFELFGRDNMTEVFVEIEKIGKVVSVALPGTGTWQDPVRSLGTFAVSLAPGTYTWWYGDVVDTRTFGRKDHGDQTFTIGVCPPATTTTAAATTTTVQPTTTTVQPTTTTAVVETTTTAAATDLGSTTTTAPPPDGPCVNYNGDPKSCDATSNTGVTVAPTTTKPFVPCPEGTDPRLPDCPRLASTTTVAATSSSASANTLPATGSTNGPLLGVGFGILVSGIMLTIGAHRRFAR